MEAIKISVDVNVNFSESAMNFVKSLFVAPSVSCGDNIVAEKEKPVAIVDDFSVTPENQERAKEFIDKVISSQLAKPAKEPETPAKPERSIEDVRRVLAEKVNEHRETIKKKLNELGAPSVTKLDPAKYDEMYNFIISL